MALDISTVGAKIVLKGFGLGKELVISEFSEEGTPFDAPDIDASENRKNLNGTMISSRTPSVYPFSITVIPGSLADLELTKILMSGSIQPGGVTKAVSLYGTCTITVPATYQRNLNELNGGQSVIDNNRTYTYSNARMKSGPTGPTSSSDGRMGARTFTFEAEGFHPDTTYGNLAATFV